VVTTLAPLNVGPEMVYSNRSSKNVQFCYDNLFVNCKQKKTW